MRSSCAGKKTTVKKAGLSQKKTCYQQIYNLRKKAIIQKTGNQETAQGAPRKGGLWCPNKGKPVFAGSAHQGDGRGRIGQVQKQRHLRTR